MSKVLIIYHSFSGNTKKMADALADGARSVAGVDVVMKTASEAQPTELESADGVAFGAPNTFGGMAGALREFFDRAWSVHEKTGGKPAVAFTCEMPDQTGALEEIKKFFGMFGLESNSDGVAAPGEAGEKELEFCKNLGKSLGEASSK